MPRPVRFLLLILLIVLFSAVAGRIQADNQPADAKSKPAKTKIDFVKDIEPIFAKHCHECHGPDSAEGRLRLDAKKIVMKGGINGPALVPGKSIQSLIVKRILGEGDLDRMPLDADPLSEKETRLIREWIDQGSHWPDEAGAQVATLETHWAYRKPQRPELPEVSPPVSPPWKGGDQQKSPVQKGGDRRGGSERAGWVRNAIDAFVLARLQQEGLSPSPEADKVRLIRRVTLDLIGIPPTLEEVDAFLSDDSPDAYEKVVDRLLASPRYGEKWAVPWLDAARYADSNGYQRDGRRVYWAYRDWVIQALNDDVPFDRFTIEQIAGDLLPDATRSQIIATGFHRGTMANVEAGTDPEEEYALAAIDRVNTTGTVWLGTSIECGQCHNHKYDPFSQKEYYQLFAFFNNTQKEIQSVGSRRDFIGPKISLDLSRERQQEKNRLQAQLEQLKKQSKTLTAKLKQQQPAWEAELVASKQSGWQVLEPVVFESLEGADLKKKTDRSLLAVGNLPGTDIYQVTVKFGLQNVSAFRVEILTDPSLPDGGPGRTEPGNFILSEFKVESADPENPDQFSSIKLVEATADYSQPRWPVKNAIDGNRKTGWAIGRQFGQGHHAVFVPQSPVSLKPGSLLRFTLDQQYGNGRTIGRFQLLATAGDPTMLAIPQNIRKLAGTPAEKRNKKQQQQLAEFYLSQSKPYKNLQARIQQAQTAYDKIQSPTSLVMQEMDKPRTTRIFERGDFLKPGEEVQPDTPASLHPFPENAPRNRLGLAQWLVDENNPLTARVTVNRNWLEFFGRGIVESIEEFGSMGEPPSHPQLLDWLATEFMTNGSPPLDKGGTQLIPPPLDKGGTQLIPPPLDKGGTQGGWSTKNIHRLIVTSSTYRQSSSVTPELLKKDPYNKLYARGPRQRLKAEYVRDNALAVAGLLSGKMYGPPVFPVQPAGVWNHIGVASNNWTTSSGEDLYRRGLYTYWRRTVPYPSLVNFDAPSREACTVKRSPSNTPLQALTLLNDPVYFEAATALAVRMLTDLKNDAAPADRVEYGFRLATSRRPVSPEVEILVNRYQSERERYRKDQQALDKLLKKWNVPTGVNRADFAAWIHVANILLNLDEVITKG